MRGYIDGAQTFNLPGFASHVLDHNDGDIRIGANGGSFMLWYEDSNLYPFAGMIDEVAIYNSALSAERVAAHYSACQAVDVAVTKTVNSTQ